jgi:undecaprenyl-diphosphatase
MDNFVAFIYGLVQGATEYLPVSSSAHLILLPHALGTPDPGLAFDVFLHIGTLLATAVYFYKDWIQIIKNPFPKAVQHANSTAIHISWLHLIIGTIPAVIVGVLLNHWIQDHTRSLWVMGITIPLFGIILWLVDKQAPRNRKVSQTTLKDMFFIGCIQTLSLVPGVSRSGSTMTAARLRGFNRQDSARISFLLALPITLGAIVYEAKHWNEIVETLNGWTPLLIGMGSALLFGALAIHYLIKLLSKMSFAIFAVYRIILGAVILLFGE